MMRFKMHKTQWGMEQSNEQIEKKLYSYILWIKSDYCKIPLLYIRRIQYAYYMLWLQWVKISQPMIHKILSPITIIWAPSSPTLWDIYYIFWFAMGIPFTLFLFFNNALMHTLCLIFTTLYNPIQLLSFFFNIYRIRKHLIWEYK